MIRIRKGVRLGQAMLPISFGIANRHNEIHKLPWRGDGCNRNTHMGKAGHMEVTVVMQDTLLLSCGVIIDPNPGDDCIIGWNLWLSNRVAFLFDDLRKNPCNLLGSLH